MDNTTGKKMANDTGDWVNNKEMNPAANSSVTEEGLLEDEKSLENRDAWRKPRDLEHGISAGVAGLKDPNLKTGDPGRTPGSAEGVEDFERKGNE